MGKDDFDLTYPQHIKLKNLEVERKTVQNFLDWLDEQEIDLCRWVKQPTDQLQVVRQTKATIIALFLGIDENALEAEKQHMLENLL